MRDGARGWPDGLGHTGVGGMSASWGSWAPRASKVARRLQGRLPLWAVHDAGALDAGGRPLILPRARLVVSWSPKSACTHVVAWFFRHQGLLDAANAHSHWPHAYRIAVYNPSEARREAARAVWRARGEGYTLLRVTRDPTPRLVSIFRHALRHPMLREPVLRAVGRDLASGGFSLRDLDRYLGTQDLGARGVADPHFRVQSHPCWTMRWDRVITLNIDTHPLDSGLAAVEAELGLDRPAAGRSKKLDRLARPWRYASDSPYEGTGPIEAHRFDPDRLQPFPKAALLASPLLEGMARRHYAADWDRVATADSAGRLFAAAATPPGVAAGA